MFNIGDKVKLVQYVGGMPRPGDEGIIVEIKEDGSYRADFPTQNHLWVFTENLELISNILDFEGVYNSYV